MPKKLKIALVHDYLREYGGAERVLEALHEMFPEAPVYTAFFDSQSLGIHAKNFHGWDIRQTYLSKIPFFRKLFSPLRILAPGAFRRLDLTAYDVVISSSNAYYAKAVEAPNGVHICYCHTPPRSLYGYETMNDWEKNWFIKIGGGILNHILRVVDFKVSQKVDVFVANSQETASRIKKFYRRNSVVINPPVQIPAQFSVVKNRDYYFYVNRLALAKHPELAIQAANQLKLPLKLAGGGKILPQLKAMAGPSIEFLGVVGDQQLAQLYAGAKALLYPVRDEDFGMIPVEAMGYGVPVVAHRSGGPKETIIEGKTGVFFDDLTVEALVAAISKFQKQHFNHKQIYEHSLIYTKTKFQQKIKKLINKEYQK